MRAVDLPSPGNLVVGIALRAEAAKAISSQEIVAARMPGGNAPGATQLREFFEACAARLAQLEA